MNSNQQLLDVLTCEGLLINVTADTVVRLLPPLTFSDDEAQLLVGMLSALIRDFLTA